MAAVATKLACLVIVFTAHSFADDTGVTDVCPVLSKKCGECIIAPGCAWCKNESYTGALCDTVNNLKENGCDLYENPETTMETIRNESLTDGTYVDDDGDETITPAIQIHPQEITLKLRQGETKRIQVKVRQAIDYPVDLYYLMDLSHSMADDLRNLQVLAKILADRIKRITQRIKLGFGSFVDKPITPYINITEGKIDAPCPGCEKTYSFRNVVPLSGNLSHFELIPEGQTKATRTTHEGFATSYWEYDAFELGPTDAVKNKISQQRVSGNLDEPEGTFDAMMQAAVCTEQIGWRKKARHLLLVTSDASYHVQGDGRVAGVIKPHDGRCHLNEQNEYTDSHIYDYPSVGQLNQKMVENNILPIFSVVYTHHDKFAILSELMQGARVATLSGDSTNVVDIIQRVYDEITGNVELTHNAPQNLDVKFTANCGSTATNENPHSCSGVVLGREVSFDIDITARGCFDGASNKSFEIYPIGLDEQLSVNVEVHCSCPCESHQEFNSPICTNGNGTLVCGVCACNQGYYGEHCQCVGEMKDEQTGAIQCKPHNQTDVVCSGRGNCICGECHCHNNTEAGGESSTGPFCECSDRKCPIFGGEVCGGPERGTCECVGGRLNRCKCNSGYTGESCGCPTRTDTCIAPQNGLTCNAEGDCKCGRCVCSSSKYFGEHCEQCVTCSECDLHINCVKCKVFEQGLTESECDMCSQIIEEVDKIPKSNDTSFKECSYTDDKKCTVFFTWKKLEANDTILVQVQRTTQCAVKKPHELPLFWIIVGTTVAVVVVGVFLLLLVRCYRSYLDRKEYDQFQKAQQDANWQEDENPLYKKGIQTFKNPMYGKS